MFHTVQKKVYLCALFYYIMPRKRQKTRKRRTNHTWQRIIRKIIGITAGIIVCGICGIIILWYFGLLPAREELPQFKKHWITFFSGYGHAQLPQAEVIGIDISHYQSYIQWGKVCFYYDRKQQLHREPSDRTKRKNIDFVIAKATQGAQMRDAFYRRNKAGAAEQGILFGAYHFYSADVSAKAQADNFIHTAHLQKGDFIPVLDVEPYHNRLPMPDSIIRWLNLVGEYYHAKPVIYTNEECYRNYFMKHKRLQDYHFWIARYGDKEPSHMHLIWQYSENGCVAGIAGPVDINVFQGTLQELYKYTLK